LAGFCDFGNGKVQLLIMSEQLLNIFQFVRGKSWSR
jgi:hypothetical protein